MAMIMYEVGVAIPLRCMKCENAGRQRATSVFDEILAHQ